MATMGPVLGFILDPEPIKIVIFKKCLKLLIVYGNCFLIPVLSCSIYLRGGRSRPSSGFHPGRPDAPVLRGHLRLRHGQPQPDHGRPPLGGGVVGGVRDMRRTTSRRIHTLLLVPEDASRGEVPPSGDEGRGLQGPDGDHGPLWNRGTEEGKLRQNHQRFVYGWLPLSLKVLTKVSNIQYVFKLLSVQLKLLNIYAASDIQGSPTSLG